MTFEQLRIFMAVAEHLHFTHAADALYITQPAVSAAIHSLETEYGLKLFHRIGRRIEITDAGKLLQVEARKILDQVKLTERGLREFNQLQQGELNLGASFTVGNYWLPEKISRFRHNYPGITIHCTLANADDICTGTASGLYDLGLIAGEVKPVQRKVLEEETVGGDRLEIIVGKEHPWFEHPVVKTEELLKTSWVMREPGSGTQQMFEQALARWGILPSELEIILIFKSSEMVKAVVESGVGATALPELMVKKELRLKTLKAIKVIDASGTVMAKITRPILQLKHCQRFQTRAAKAFEALLLDPSSGTR
ncbi:LysR substrate-binding domain-containing protein [Synechocystis sp. LKSZ1]|uniref:LysR substrate-binding domain-containing protein n=1 Tax=Synechocystis sp. LKSZ1 TaxID=3144951 RepID=UPI00336BD899